MSERPSPLPPFRRELLNWFRESARPSAPAYKGAFRLLEDVGFPGRVHLIAHAVRDICDRLIYVLQPQDPPYRVQYENGMDEIVKEWPTLSSFGDDRDRPAPADQVEIPYTVASRIDALLQAHRSRRERPSNQRLLLQFLIRSNPMGSEVNQRLVRDFKDTREWFMRWAHFPAESVPGPGEVELEDQFRVFERTLHGFVGPYFTTTRELDEILQQANQ